MKTAVFSTKPYDRNFLEGANADGRHELHFLETRLTPETAPLAASCQSICAFVNDRLDAEVLGMLHEGGVRFVALRCAGFNNIDLAACARLGISVARVPAYSPHAVAEHTVALILALNRKLHRAYNRVREGNFALDGLLGFDMRGKTVGLIGTGRIGVVAARILRGFECRVLAFDPQQSEAAVAAGVEYLSLDDLLAQADILSLHCPLTPETHYLINHEALERMRDGVMLINTSRGRLIDTPALIDSLKRGKVSAVGLDVYEEEGDVFFEDLSNEMIQDDVLARLLTFPNVIVTGHQAFFTREAMLNIAATTVANLTGFDKGEVNPECLLKASPPA